MMVSLDQTAKAGFLIRLDSPSGASYRHEIRELVHLAIDRGEKRIVVDCELWGDLDLVKLSLLLRCADQCATSNVRFELANVSNTARGSIDTLHLSARLGVPTVALAEAAASNVA